jgi:hypothetical protein
MTYSPLDLVENYLRRFVIYPSDHAVTAHVLWIAHCHLMDCWETTPRLAFMSPEKESVRPARSKSPARSCLIPGRASACRRRPW